MARAHAGGAALTELHSPSWPRVAKKEPMVVVARDSQRGGRRPIVESEGVGEVGARRRTPRATRRIKEECEAELSVAEAIPSL